MDYKSLPNPIKYQIAGLPTLFFLFDLDLVEAKLRELREALSPDQVYYAVKCNSLPPILSTASTESLVKYGYVPFDRQVLGVEPYVETDLSPRNLRGLRIELR